MDLTANLGKKLRLRNPLILVSGVNDLSLGLFRKAEEAMAGGVVTKSFNLEGKKGNRNPTVVIDDRYVLNAIGLSNPGADYEAKLISSAKKQLSIPVIASVFGADAKEYSQVIERVQDSKPDAIELDLSCPHSKNVEIFDDMVGLRKILSSCASISSIPVFAKLSPAVTIRKIKEIVNIIEDSGCYGITAVNTMPAMLIDINARSPVLSNKVGGLSGYCLKPIALRVVYEVRKHTELPVIGIGGVSDPESCIQMLLAGANAVGIGTSTQNGFGIFKKIHGGLRSYMVENRFNELSDIKLL